MSRWIECERCGARNAQSDIVMQQYKQLFMSAVNTSGDVRPGRMSPTWDLCGPCTQVVREFITDSGDVTARSLLDKISKVLVQAGIEVVGINTLPVAVATVLQRQVATVRGQREQPASVPVTGPGSLPDLAALPATEQPDTNEG